METTAVNDAHVENRLDIPGQQRDREYGVLSRISHPAKKHLSQSRHKKFCSLIKIYIFYLCDIFAYLYKAYADIFAIYNLYFFSIVYKYYYIL